MRTPNAVLYVWSFIVLIRVAVNSNITDNGGNTSDNVSTDFELLSTEHFVCSTSFTASA